MNQQRIHQALEGEGVRLHTFERNDDSYRGAGFYDLQDNDQKPFANPQAKFRPSSSASRDIKRSYSPVVTSLSLKAQQSWHQRPQNWFDTVFGGWWQEILSMFLAMAMFAALIATLRLYDGRALQEWPLAISINALISVQSVIMKTALIVVIAQGMSSIFYNE
jgi:hypothetical protein